MAYAGPIARLVQQLAKLPGIGEKTAARLAFHILRGTAENAAALAAAITEIKQKIRFCSVCCDLTERDPCVICSDARRDESVVCVVAQPQDVVAIERAGGFRGRYHVRITELIRRCASGTAEVILATSPSVEGEATAVYIAKLVRPLGVRPTRIATGVPIGGELEYADQVTLARAIDGRRDI